jgi:UMF1 family MFS transporter
VLFILANGCFGASIVVYNSFLPEIAPPDQRDSLSSKGWALGYGAGCLMLIAHLILLGQAEKIGITQTMAVRLALLSTGIWWALFTIPVFKALRNRGKPRHIPKGVSVISMAFGQFLHTLKHMRQYPNTLKFLIGYLLYNDAIQTVFLQAAVFGKFELGLDNSQLAITILISNLVGIAGALLFNKLASRITPKGAVIVTLVIWMSLLFYAYGFVHNVTEFYIMGAAAGLVMGGSQALSRSIFAQLVPHGKEAEYFSIYEVGDKGTSWLGPPAFGIALQFTGSYRVAILSLLIFFVAGLLVLVRTDVKQGEWDVLKSA